MIKHQTISKLPYDSPTVSIVALSHEQAIATGSSSVTLSDMDNVDIFDETFTPLQ